MHRPNMPVDRKNRFFTCALILVLAGSVFAIAAPSTTLIRPSFAASNNISVDIDAIKYGQGDDVTITGSINDPVSGEDQVTIKVKDPDAVTLTSKVLTLDSHDEFDMVYSIDNTADDGIYTVQVQYSTDKLYSFFIVDEQPDTVTVHTDHSTYNGGDDVVVSGIVDHTVTGQDAVQITITDPNNAKILSSKDVTLGAGSGVADDAYKYTFTNLSTDTDPGRYAVKVGYDSDNQEGFAIFTVEAASSANQITASLDKSTYKPGDSVTLTGTIDNVDSSLDLKIVVKDPTSQTIKTNSNVAVESNGNFDFNFDLDSAADVGTYTVTMTYGSDDLQLTFSVSESGTSTSGLIVKLSKSSLLAGETMTVTGTVPKIVVDEDVNILVYDSNSIFAGIAAYVTPNSDKTYSATLKLKSDLQVDDGYEVRVDYNGEEVVAKFAITGQSTASDVLTVTTDKPQYPAESTVKISGKVSADELVEGVNLLIQVYNPEQAAYRFDQVSVNDDGSYTYSMVVGGKLGIPGEYEVRASYNGKLVKTTFEITGGKSSYSLKAAGQTYQVLYDITNGQIKSMFVNEDQKKLVIALDASDDGQLTLVLPRVVIDAVQDGKDVKYLLASTDLEAGASATPDVTESETTDESRTIVIEYTKGTDLIEISGTTVVPEFGPISVIILALAIVAVILITPRFRYGNSETGGKFFNL